MADETQQLTVDTLKLSPYDQNQLDLLADEVIYAVHSQGEGSRRDVRQALKKAMFLGFTMVSRGESLDGQKHPPSREWMSKKREFEVGDTVAWTSQSQGFTTDKVGTVVGVIPRDVRPSKESFPGLYRTGSGPGYSRNHVSYVVEVREGDRKPRQYWPIAAKLKLV